MTNKIRKISIVLIAAVLLVLMVPAGSVSAQTRSVVVARRDADITILQSGEIRVEETWEVVFANSPGSSPWTFAFRSIPLNKVEEIKDWGVQEGGRVFQQAGNNAPFTYSLTNENGEEKITWYFDPTTNTTRTFVLSYSLVGALEIREEGDSFFWKFIESDRGYFIQNSEVNVHLPTAVTIDQILIQSFVNNNSSVNETNDGILTTSDTVRFRHSSFQDGTEWEIAVGFPHGYVTAEPPGWQKLADLEPIFSVVALAISIVLAIGGGLGLYLLWFVRGRDKNVGKIAEFYPRPPEDVPPGIAGTLLDEMADMQDIIATLVDLAQRGYINIEETKKASFGSKGDFRFLRLTKETAMLREYEKVLMRSVFGNRQEKKLKNLKNKFYKDIPKIKTALYDEVTEIGYFPMNPEKVRSRYLWSGCSLFVLFGLIGFGIFTIAGEFTPFAICAALALGVFPIGLMFLSRAMPRKTSMGSRSAEKWAAFKRYLENIEKYTKLDTAREQFDQYLPYAIAFGLEKTWVQKFAQVSAPPPTWYGMYTPQGPVYHGGARRGYAQPTSGESSMPSLDSAAEGVFGSLESMSTGLFSMLDNAANTFQSVPQSSSSGGGYSGGGFSGGGGGGGGSSGFG